MKRIILVLAIMALVFPATQRAKAGANVSLDFFYNNLNDGGNWIEAGDYGYCWQPSVAVSNHSWRPYSDGYWAYTDVGWTWVSYEDFGWATYHYGRWARLHDQGWVWVPGREWGPAWVSWRTGGDHVGWAPLPPRYGGGRGEVVYEGRAINNTVDIDFDIGPEYYNFVDVRYIGEPLLRDRIYDSSQNIAYINGTVNVTNITYNNSTVYNYGPDYNRLSAYSTRPIQRLTLERQTNADYAAAAQAGAFTTKVQGDRLVVAAPQLLQAPAPQQQLAPKTVKTRIAKADVETGWSGITDAKSKAELQQKMKKEDPKKVPPPQMKPTNPAALTAAPSPDAAASTVGATIPAMVVPPAAKGKDKNKRDALGRPVQPTGSTVSATTDPNAATASVASPNDLNGRGKDKNKRSAAGTPVQRTGSAVPATADPNVATTTVASPNDLKGRGKDKNKRGGNNPAAQSLISQPDGTPEPGAPVNQALAPNDNKSKGKDRGGKRSVRDQSGQPPLAPQDGAAPAPTTPEAQVTPQQNARAKKDKRGEARPAPQSVPVVQPTDDMPAPRGKKSERGNGGMQQPETPGVPPEARGGGAPRGEPPQGKAQRLPREQLQPVNRPEGEAAPPPQGQGKSGKGKKGKPEEVPSPAPDH